MSRSVTGTIGRWFDETETAKVAKWVKEMDPSFTQESFLRELRDYIVPELVDAYVNADQPTLRQWCSEAVRSLLVLSLMFSADNVQSTDLQRPRSNPARLHRSLPHL
jgi:import inner membrane translocase subunit TIM44